MNPILSILYINSVSLFVYRGLKIKITFNKTVPSNSKAIQYFEFLLFTFYIRFCAATVVVNERDIFEIWKVSEKIWVRFFWATSLEGS